jgi:hypothetical protein
METNKTCFKCHLEKPITAFYKHIGMADGHLNKCIDCTKKDESTRYRQKSKDKSFVEKERLRGRKKYHSLYAGIIKPTQNQNFQKEYRKKYPEKIWARAVVNKHTKTRKGHHNHHWSYRPEDALDFIELTIKDHCKAHRFIQYDQERMMYRSVDGVLLETRERHEAYIRHMIQVMED